MLESFSDSRKFDYIKLSLEEQKARGILGRLTGVIADTKNPTRNERKYNKDLWENVFNNDIIKEKIANRCFFGELGHPTDREEVDMEKIAICLAEQPKFCDDGLIYGVFDILDTPNGRILKTLCDYGCNIGVSSRGTGDLYTDINGNEAVDPETYICECWDAVLIPAVKVARMTYVKESLENKKSLRQALTESLMRESEDKRKEMEETLKDLGIELEDKELEEDYNKDEWEDSDIELHKNTDWASRNYGDLIVDDDSFEDEATVYRYNKDPESKKVKFVKHIRPNPIFPPFYAPEEDPFEDALGPMYNGKTHGKYDIHSRFEDQKTYDALSESDETSTSSESTNEESSLENNKECNSENCTDKENNDKEVDNVEAEKLVAELQESLLKVKQLEKDNLSLQEKLSVCITKEAKNRELNTQLEYSKAKINSLQEELNKKDKANSLHKSRIVDLKSRIFNLTESSNENKEKLEESILKIEDLNEQVKTLTKDLNSTSKQLEESKDLIIRYKKSYSALKESYLDVKANSCGLRKEDVLNKLNSSYKIKDIDSVCESLSAFKTKMEALPFRITEDTKISVKKSTNEPILSNNRFMDDEVSQNLLNLLNQ